MEVESCNRLWEGLLRGHRVRNFKIWGPLTIYYDSDAIRDQVRSLGAVPIIPMRSNSKKENNEFDSFIYKLRHLVENLFARLKHFRSIFTRFEQLARNFKSMAYLACSLIWLRSGK